MIEEHENLCIHFKQKKARFSLKFWFSVDVHSLFAASKYMYVQTCMQEWVVFFVCFCTKGLKGNSAKIRLFLVLPYSFGYKTGYSSL